MKAIYSPKSTDNIMTYSERCIGNTYEFKFWYELNGIKYYQSADVNFVDSRPIPATDLEEIKQ